MNNLDPAIIVDLDGTLSNCEWRLPFIQNKPKQWGKFFRGIPKDEIILPVKDYIEKIRTDYNNTHGEFVTIIFLTARPHHTAKDTIEWLNRHGYDSHLYMRKDGDYRPDYIVKEEIFKDYIKGLYNVLCVLDDKEEVRNMFEVNHGVKAIDPLTII